MPFKDFAMNMQRQSFPPNHAELPSEVELYDLQWETEHLYFVLRAWGREQVYKVPESEVQDIVLWLSPDCVEYHQSGKIVALEDNPLDPENDLRTTYQDFTEYRRDYGEHWDYRKIIAVGLQTKWSKYKTEDEQIPFEFGSLRVRKHDGGGVDIRTFRGEGEELEPEQVQKLIEYLS